MAHLEVSCAEPREAGPHGRLGLTWDAPVARKGRGTAGQGGRRPHRRPLPAARSLGGSV